jgi:hypothetical protein
MEPVVPAHRDSHSAHAIPVDDHGRTYCGKTVESHWREVRINVTCNRCRITIRKMRGSGIL